jgi:hypothetical protein
MEGYHSWTVYEKELISLRQYYDFTYHLYNQEKDTIQKMYDEHQISFQTTIGITTHDVEKLLSYTRNRYPQKLRELVLINLISITEVFFVKLIKEIFYRDKSYFKINQKIDLNISELFSYSTINLLHKKIINRDIRRLTSGGINEIEKYYKKYFGIDFASLGIPLKQYYEYFDCRHLFVHSNGIIDVSYSKKYHANQIGDRIILTNNYIDEGIMLFRKFGKSLIDKLLILLPDRKRVQKQYNGNYSISVNGLFVIDITITNVLKYINEILDHPIKNITVKDIVVRYFITDENNLKIVVSLEQIIPKDFFPILKSFSFIEEYYIYKLC